MRIITYRTAEHRAIYDCEVMPNFFSMGVINVDTLERSVIEISETKNEYDKLVHLTTFLRGKSIMVGYNNVGFDWVVVDTILRSVRSGITDWQDLTHVAFKKCDQIIQDGRLAKSNPTKYGLLKFKHRINDPIVPQLDLFLLWHYDNKMVSLKTLEFNMGMEQVKSLPIPPGTWTTREEQLQLMDYMINHDCVATLEFLNRSMEKIDLREDYTVQYGLNFSNFSDSKMGSVFMERKLQEAGVETKHWVDGKRQNKGTPRAEMKMTDILLDINRFRSPELQSVLSFLRTMTITKTKGAFTDLPTSETGELTNYLHRKGDDATGKPLVKRQLKRLGKVFPERMESLHCVFKGFTFVFGTGGLHGSVEGRAFTCEDDEEIMDVDVTSFYPSMAIANKWFPEHLGEAFTPIYRGMFEDRLKYPKKTHKNLNLSLKLTLNGTYGNLINPFSFLYDPLVAMRITINGQLHLAMLAETLMMDIDGLLMIQANTDGITFKMKRKYHDKVKAIVAQWEEYTGMAMEYAEYSRMWLLNVNNYLAEKAETGELKQKGLFEYNYESYGAWDKNFGNRVVAKAATNYLVHGVPTMWTLASSPNYDFMSTAKVTGQSKIMYGDDQPIQNNTRFYYSKVGKPIMKIMPPLPAKPDKWRLMALTNKGVPTQPCNTTTDIDRGNIDFNWYAASVSKLTAMTFN